MTRQEVPGQLGNGDLEDNKQVNKEVLQVFQEKQKVLLEEPTVLGQKNNEEMYLADESRWENMKSDPKPNNDEAKLSDLSEKYQRLLKAKEASDVRIIDLLDKNAELVTINTKCSDEIRKLKNEMNNESNRKESLRANEATESNLLDLRTLNSLKSQGHSRTSPGTQPKNNSVEEAHPCKVCKTIFSNREALNNHMKKHEFDCDKCSFKTDTKEQMNKHMQSSHKQVECDKFSFKTETKEQMNKHMQSSHKDLTPIKCSFCPDSFIEKKNLFAHKKQRHPTYQPCRNGQNCAYIESCSFNHTAVTDGASICYHCGKEFKSNNDLVNHRKNDHSDIICTKFLKGQCKKEPCWYMHITSEQPLPTLRKTQGFRQTKPTQSPPEKEPQRSNPPISNNPILTSIIEMLRSQQNQMNQMTQALQILATNNSTENV